MSRKKKDVQLNKYSIEQFIQATFDLSLKVNNAYFKAPFVRCPNCDKSNSTILAYFGEGGKNKIGNLKGFNATIGDVIGWKSATYSGLSIVKNKNNGVFELETEHFNVPRREPAIIERMIVPSMYRKIIEEMATYLANKENYKKMKLVEIGKTEYPDVIEKKL